jgi:hypothetical protein
MSKAPFDISGEAMLSAKANRLLEAELTSQTRMAEWLLGIQAITFSTDLDDDVEIMLAIQVNFQLEQGVDAAVYRDWQEADLRSVYAERFVDPRAAAMAARLIATASSDSVMSPVTSLR